MPERSCPLTAGPGAPGRRCLAVGNDPHDSLAWGLCEELARWRAVHDPGQVVADLAASVAPGGDCLADIALLREEPDLAGPVASDPVVSRLVATLARDLPRSLPLSGFAQNQVWCEIAALACELLAWTQRVALTGAARRREPKRLRLRLLSVAGRPARSGRRHLRRNSPPAGHPRPADQPGHPFDTEGETARARGTPPTGRDSRAAQHSLNVKPERAISPRPVPQATTSRP